jgi:DNA-binding NarL/FixJ family response regulator
MDPLPKASAFVTCVKVEEPDGSSYIVNEGLNEEISERYETTIISLNQSLEIVRLRIKQFRLTPLTDKEKKIIGYAINGKSTKEIANLMYSVKRTIQRSISEMIKRYKCANVEDFKAFVTKHNLID